MPRIRYLSTRSAVAGAALAVAAASGVTVAAVVGSPSSAAAACESGYVALTYDDGPTGSTGALLNALRSAGARATMFNMGRNVQQNQAQARAQTQAGMWVENHSYTHPHMTQLSAAQMTSELSQTQQAIQQATGTTPRLFRPPYGETNATLRSAASQLGLTEVIWTVDSQDWNGASTQQIVQAANSLQPGGVILMHDGYQTTINAVSQIVANLASRGLCPGMISPTTGRAVAPDGTTPGNPPTGGPMTPPPGGAGCDATFREIQRWGDRFNGEVTIRAGATAATNWTATVRLAGSQRVSTTWNGTFSTDSGGSVITVTPSGNGNLPAGGSTSFGFTVMANGNFSAPAVSCQF